MSFDLAFWFERVPSTPEHAQELYDRFWASSEDVAPVLCRMAGDHGLTVYDPQTRSLLSQPGSV